MEKRRAKRGEAIAFFRAALATDTNECIIWPFGTGGHGYPDIKGALDDEPHTCGHRAVCVIKHGDRRSEALEAAHSCGVRRCINHNHIRWATYNENTEDRRTHGTLPIGEKSPVAKLTDAQINEIRLSKEPARVLAERYACHMQYVWMIRNNKTRKTVT